MECPLCGNEMKKGFVQSARRVLFTKEQNEGFFDIKAKDDIVLSSNNWTHPTCIAYHCRDCKKVIIDYSQTIQ